jgi:hypothetical protein
VTAEAEQLAPPALTRRHNEHADYAERGCLSRAQALYGNRDSDRCYSSEAAVQSGRDTNG